MRSFFFRCKRDFRYASTSFGEGIAHRRSRAGQYRNFSEAVVDRRIRSPTHTSAPAKLPSGQEFHQRMKII